MDISYLGYASDSDLPDICRIWELSFEDSARLVEKIFKASDLIKNTVVARSGSKTVSLMCALDNVQYPGMSYLYAICTDPEYRGLGIGGRVLRATMDCAYKRGMTTLFLHPADDSLSGWYQKEFGMLPWGYYGFSKVSVTGSSADAHEIPPEEYFRAYGSSITPEMRSTQLLIAGAYGGHFLKAGGTLVYAEKRNGRITVKDHIGPLESDALSAIGGYFGVNTVTVRNVSPESSDISRSEYLLYVSSLKKASLPELRFPFLLD